jgi:hypothetical protein
VQLAAPVVAAFAAYSGMPLEVWDGIANGLLAFLGLLVAALVQVISITASFGHPQSLPSPKIKRLIVALELQQRLWLAMLCIAFFSAVLVVFGTAIAKHGQEVIQEHSIRRTLAPWASALIAFSLTFLVIRSVLIIPGILSLQKLKGQLDLETAKQRERFFRPALSPECNMRNIPSVVPENFGKKVYPIDTVQSTESKD